MHKSRSKRRIALLGPGSLAVLSCALALLAAQPAVRASEATMSRSLVMAADTGTVGGQVITAETGIGRKSAVRNIRKEAPVSASPRVHILATMEMVTRWLSAVVQPVRMDVSGGWVWTAEAGVFEIIMCPPYRVLAVNCAGMTVERGFAIGHCLSAPPAV